MITKAQISLLHIARAKLGFDDEIYRAALMVHGGVASAKELDEAGFERVMEYFTTWGFQWKRKNYGSRKGMASPAQVALVRHLWREYTGGEDEAALNKWLEHSYGISALRFATPAIASKAINGLKRMAARRPLNEEKKCQIGV